MKKLIILGLSLFGFVANGANGLFFNLKEYIRYHENEGVVYLPAVVIDWQGTSVKSFDIEIPRDKDFIFDANLASIRINNSTGFTAKLNFNNKMLTFQGVFSGNTEIRNIYIRTYDLKIEEAKIKLHFSGENTFDYTSINYVDLIKDGRYSHTTKPLPISNLKYNITGNNLNLIWNPSPDLDTISTVIRLTKNNNFVKDEFVGSRLTGFQFTDLNFENENKYTVEMYVKDQYYASESITINNIEKSKIVPVATGNNVVSTNNLPNKIIYTGTNIITSKAFTGNIVPIKKEIISTGNQIINKYNRDRSNIQFKNPGFMKFQNGFNNFIAHKMLTWDNKKLDSLIELRTKFLDLFQNYELGKINFKATKDQLNVLILDFKLLNIN